VQHRAQTVTQLLYPYSVCTSMHVCTYVFLHTCIMHVYMCWSASLLQWYQPILPSGARRDQLSPSDAVLLLLASL
jgi:hypothetical protein